MGETTMAYDAGIQQQIESICAGEEGLTSKNMFGGVCYLLQGNMAFGIYKDHLIVRLGSDEEARKAIGAGKAAPFDITGRVMTGWVMIPKGKLRSREQYKRWLDKGLAFARSLPSK
jgi:TfoX/Sxy family transcriptional regulator of competence genes